jgi:hypothetical protein
MALPDRQTIHTAKETAAAASPIDLYSSRQTQQLQAAVKDLLHNCPGRHKHMPGAPF